MFDSRFEVFLADTALAHRLHYQIRYRVFCMDQGFEDPSKGNLDQERDHWDRDSLQFLVREKATGQWVATMRMILPESKPFPVESLCDLNLIKDFTYRRDASCEISRLCMVRRYRGRQGLTATADSHDEESGTNSGLERAAEPEIMLGLFRAALAYSRENNLRQWYFLITPALARIIKRIGVSLEQIGAAIEHRGTRAPYVTDPFASCASASNRSALIREMFSAERPAYQLFSDVWPEYEVAAAG